MKLTCFLFSLRRRRKKHLFYERAGSWGRVSRSAKKKGRQSTFCGSLPLSFVTKRKHIFFAVQVVQLDIFYTQKFGSVGPVVNGGLFSSPNVIICLFSPSPVGQPAGRWLVNPVSLRNIVIIVNLNILQCANIKPSNVDFIYRNHMTLHVLRLLSTQWVSLW